VASSELDASGPAEAVDLQATKANASAARSRAAVMRKNMRRILARDGVHDPEEVTGAIHTIEPSMSLPMNMRPSGANVIAAGLPCAR
jgi:hypothetical protein